MLVANDRVGDLNVAMCAYFNSSSCAHSPCFSLTDYYAVRAELVLQQALTDAAAGTSLNLTVLSRTLAEHAYNWTTASNEYPVSPVGDALQVSLAMQEKYADVYAICSQ